MKKLEKLYKQLELYSNFDEGDNDEKFLNTADKIVEIRDPNSMPALLKYFDDNERSWVLESFKGIIKSSRYLNEKLFAKTILKNIHIMIPHAKEWAEGFLYIILNEKECLKTLKQNMHLADKTSLTQLFDLIYEESEEHRPIIDELRTILNSK